MVGRSGEEDYCHDLDQLPPGFRFYPTDEEIIMHYLLKKVIDRKFTAIALGEADFNKCEPWDLPKKAKIGEKEWFLFCQRDRKYPTGMRTNRATERGYWKATGKDKEIYTKNTNLVGMKKTLVFYQGRAPKGDKSNWVMHEYRLEGNFSSYNFSRVAKESWVVCKVFHKSISGFKTSSGGVELEKMDSFMIHLQNDIPTLPSMTECGTYHQRLSNSCFATDYHKSETKPHIYSNNYELQSDNHHQKTFFVPPDDNYDPNPIIFPSRMAVLLHYQPSSVGYQCQGGSTGRSSMFLSKGIDQVNSRLHAPSIVMKDNISSNSMVSHSHDKGISTAMANEITSMPSERKKQFDQELIEGLAFSPNMSDLESLWSY